MRPIYLDYNATTPIDPAVLRAMDPYLGQNRDSPLGLFGNPSSSHEFGQEAHRAVDKARNQVAQLLGAYDDEIIFTGGGSGASNHAIKGLFFHKCRSFLQRWLRGFRLITSTIEHPATLRPCEYLETLGCKVTRIPVDKDALVDLEALERALKAPAFLVSIMHSNNEVGTIQPIRDIAAMAHRRGALVHTDVAQSLGKIPINVRELDVDLMTIAGHKVYAPKGIGVLFVRRGVKLEPLLHGAGHELGRRAGTENVPYIVGLGQACSMAQEGFPNSTQHLVSHRDLLWKILQDTFQEDIIRNGHPTQRLPNTLNISFPGLLGSDILACLPGIAASTGSACHEGKMVCSPVLQAMGIPPRVAQGAIRLSVGRFTTEEEVRRAAGQFKAQIKEKLPN